MAVDPVCKMTVDEKKAAASYNYRGKTYYFCAAGCKEAFSKDWDCTSNFGVHSKSNTKSCHYLRVLEQSCGNRCPAWHAPCSTLG